MKEPVAIGGHAFFAEAASVFEQSHVKSGISLETRIQEIAILDSALLWTRRWRKLYLSLLASWRQRPETKFFAKADQPCG